MSLGMMVVAGVAFPIDRVELRDGKIWFVARKQGPLAAGRGWPTVFGADGRGVFQGPSEFDWPAISAGAYATITLPMQIDQADPDPGGPPATWNWWHDPQP